MVLDADVYIGGCNRAAQLIPIHAPRQFRLGNDELCSHLYRQAFHSPKGWSVTDKAFTTKRRLGHFIIETPCGVRGLLAEFTNRFTVAENPRDTVLSQIEYKPISTPQLAKFDVIPKPLTLINIIITSSPFSTF